MIRFCSLGSGSTGNATVVEASGGITTTRLLVDAGFSMRELELRLARAGLDPTDLDAVFVTHEHSDHIGCAIAFAEKHRLGVWMSRGTWRAIGEKSVPERLGFVRDGEKVALGDLELYPFTVAHDAAEPLQLRCSDGNASLGVLTDLGSITEHMLVGAHLSRENNRPEIVRSALAACWGSSEDDIVIADPQLGCPWLQVG